MTPNFEPASSHACMPARLLACTYARTHARVLTRASTQSDSTYQIGQLACMHASSHASMQT